MVGTQRARTPRLFGDASGHELLVPLAIPEGCRQGIPRCKILLLDCEGKQWRLALDTLALSSPPPSLLMLCSPAIGPGGTSSVKSPPLYYAMNQ